MGNQDKTPASDEHVEKGGQQVEESVLEKSLDALQEIVNGSALGRQQALGKQLAEGKLSKAESAELIKLLASDNFDSSTSQSIAKSLDPSQEDKLQKAIDVTPYLDELHTRLSGAMIDLAKRVEKSDASHEEQVTVLAKGLLDIGAAVVNIDRKLAAITQRAQPAAGPVRAPKAQGVPGARPIEKSMGAVAPETISLSKGQVFEVLEDMMQKSMASQNEIQKGLSPNGCDLSVETAMFEQSGTVTERFKPELMAAIRERVQQSRQ